MKPCLTACYGTQKQSMHTYIYTYMHIYIYIHTYIHTYIHRECPVLLEEAVLDGLLWHSKADNAYIYTHTYIHTYIRI